jgi:hypothetical protein
LTLVISTRRKYILWLAYKVGIFDYSNKAMVNFPILVLEV